jgi:hypothetical protein
MFPDANSFQATGRQKILIIFIAGRSQKKNCKNIYPVLTECFSSMIASSANFYMQRDVGFPHINYIAGKVDDEAAVNCRVEQTKVELMLSLMSIGCRGYFGIVQCPCS